MDLSPSLSLGIDYVFTTLVVPRALPRMLPSKGDPIAIALTSIRL